MLPCKVFLGLSAPAALKPPAPKPPVAKQTYAPLRPPRPEAAVAPRSGRSVRSVSTGHFPGRTTASSQSHPGFISSVPLVVASATGPRLPERGRAAASQAASAGAAQISSFIQAQQAQPSSQHQPVRAAVVPFNRLGEGPPMPPVYRAQLPTPVITTVQSMHGVAPSAQFPAYIVQVPSAATPAEKAGGSKEGVGSAGGAAAAAPPTASYASLATQSNGGGQMACLVGPNGELYLRSNATSSSGNATPLSEQRMNACTSPSSAGRSVSGRVSRTPVPVLVVQGRSQSVAPPLPRVHAEIASKPVEEHGETGMVTGEVRTPGKKAEDSMVNRMPIELDPSLQDVLDGQMLSSRSRLLAMELKAAREHCKAIQEGFKEETKHLKQENERLLLIVETIQKRIEDLQIQLAVSRKAPTSGDVRVDLCSGLASDIIDSRVNATKELSDSKNRGESSSPTEGDAGLHAAGGPRAVQSFDRSKTTEAKDQATEHATPTQGYRLSLGEFPT
ncbi:hypothetical protein, conserved [Eimeria brunetti]|uniref:Uncharacterized protein n=1 Tax=Eimeria brunetti TaxID=51314 RepID=U6LBT7_9EIME|nr:hypothetical protein, conserved [Eimeria brunetti]